MLQYCTSQAACPHNRTKRHNDADTTARVPPKKAKAKDNNNDSDNSKHDSKGGAGENDKDANTTTTNNNVVAPIEFEVRFDALSCA